MDEFTVDVPVRYRDLDPLDHVNHAVYASYLEAARTDYLEAVLDVAPEEISFVIANLEIDYRRPIVTDDEPEVALWVSRLGDSSCTMAYEIRVGDDIAATAETTMVHVDPDSKGPAPLPDETREALLTASRVEPSA
ncbi:acyl-CoA thioesterase [Natronobacterium gregoryi]|uniref:Acyl-CoA thioester hydrolase, YbgC/YbaW family n=2 Tax=Natronobacterium gregoryi TaxID=44930 RepID=L0AFF9_NATGS|nr:thioesterase family protein [Natronobacterium gregoryi]AFZ72164.1 acyl-CoA thioester hydrolase, YbgC/YbaW family [Natronobacterium gregoryi SP2]ELY63062.1 thioesterase superfamily protein [Natronobacterium gregoryi SP2]PLK20109.1 acyl-CoA thioesterase [Natronobacterium gregoryi SP2]SFJ33078.1 acyl-CoA thioester hydrolase [Natronobacterium gregoryi]